MIAQLNVIIVLSQTLTQRQRSATTHGFVTEDLIGQLVGLEPLRHQVVVVRLVDLLVGVGYAVEVGEVAVEVGVVGVVIVAPQQPVPVSAILRVE